MFCNALLLFGPIKYARYCNLLWQPQIWTLHKVISRMTNYFKCTGMYLTENFISFTMVLFLLQYLYKEKVPKLKTILESNWHHHPWVFIKNNKWTYSIQHLKEIRTVVLFQKKNPQMSYLSTLLLTEQEWINFRRCMTVFLLYYLNLKIIHCFDTVLLNLNSSKSQDIRSLTISVYWQFSQHIKPSSVYYMRRLFARL